MISIFSGCASDKPHPLPVSNLPPAKVPGAMPVHLAPYTEPAEALPVNSAGEYHLDVGDVVEVSLYRANVNGNNDLRRQMAVRSDGKISYFLVGDIQANGLTTEELRREIMGQLSLYIRSPEVAVFVVEPAKKRVYVVGEVVEQGIRELRRGQGDTLIESVFLSKGLTKKADIDRAYVIRRNAVIPVSLGDQMFNGSRSKNTILQSEDIVYIPEALEQRIFVLGRVRNPGAFELSRPIRLTEAIALAEDFTLGAKRDSVKIIRGGLPRGTQPPDIVTVDVDKIRAGTQEDVYVQRGDIVLTSPTLLGQWNEILTQLIPSLHSFFTSTILGRELGGF